MTRNARVLVLAVGAIVVLAGAAEATIAYRYLGSISFQAGRVSAGYLSYTTADDAQVLTLSSSSRSNDTILSMPPVVDVSDGSWTSNSACSPGSHYLCVDDPWGNGPGGAPHDSEASYIQVAVPNSVQSFGFGDWIDEPIQPLRVRVGFVAHIATGGVINQIRLNLTAWVIPTGPEACLDNYGYLITDEAYTTYYTPWIDRCTAPSGAEHALNATMIDGMQVYFRTSLSGAVRMTAATMQVQVRRDQNDLGFTGQFTNVQPAGATARLLWNCTTLKDDLSLQLWNWTAAEYEELKEGWCNAPGATAVVPPAAINSGYRVSLRVTTGDVNESAFTLDVNYLTLWWNLSADVYQRGADIGWVFLCGTAFVAMIAILFAAHAWRRRGGIG